MGKTAVVHQPDFVPYLGFFHRLLHADLYVILDHVQFVGSSRSWHRRDKIKTAKGEAWISVPVQHAARGAAINTVRLSEHHPWRTDHLNLIRHNYAKARFFSEVFPHIEKLYAYPGARMMEFNLASIHLLMELFDIKIAEIVASRLEPEGRSNDLIVDILKKSGATDYLSGIGARDYFRPEPFERVGVRVIWQNFLHPVYPQLHGPFTPYLSSIDLLLNCGIERSREILRSECDPK
jgi:hypothetical protein